MRSIGTRHARASRSLALCCVLAGVPAALAGTGPASLIGLGTLPGMSDSRANAVSADGRVVVGSCGYPPSSSRAFRWTAEDGMTDLGALSPGVGSEATAVNADGTVVVGVSGGIAFRWTAQGGIQSLGTLPGATSSRAYGVSGDGSIIVGASGNFAFRWTSSGGMVSLGTLPGGTASTASAISGDGSTVVGWSDDTSDPYLPRQGFRWTAGGGMVGFGPVSLQCIKYQTQPTALSDDGSVIAGVRVVTTIGCCGPGGGGCTNYTTHYIFRQTRDSRPSLLQGSGQASLYASDINGDGSFIVGSASFFITGAYAWDDAGHTLLLGQRFAQLGLVADWQFMMSSAEGISDDGQTLVGTALHNGQTEAWIAHVPVLFPHPGDINNDGVVDVADLLAVLAAWGPCATWPQCPTDIAPPGAPDGAIDVNDLLQVIMNWS